MGEPGTRRICLEIRDQGAWLYSESSASKKHCQALITDTMFLEARVEIRKWCLWEAKLSGRNYSRADAGRVSEASEWESRASLTCWGPRDPETRKQLQHQATAVPLLTPTLLRSCCRPAPHSPCGGENFPPPPPLRVGSTGERRRRRSCPSRARKALGAWEAAWCLCLWRPPTSPPSTWRARRKQRRQAFAQRTELFPDTRPELGAGSPALVPSTTGPPGLIPISWPPRPQNSGCSLLGPRSQLHPRAPLPLALLPTHTAPAQLPPRRLDRRFLATARMRPTPPGTTGAAVWAQTSWSAT